MQGQVRFQVGAVHRLPLRQRLFTHVWMLGEPLPAQRREAYGEAFHVLRPGAHLALHLDRAENEQLARVAEALHLSGFVELAERRAAPAEQAYSCHIARMRLQNALPGAGAVWGNEPGGRGVTACVQVFARRPS
jgi:hypothetical protein